MNIFPEGAFPDPEQVKIERILKAERWQELAEHYGTAASMVNPYLGDEDETSFLRQLEQLDYTIAHPTSLTVHAHLGYPIVKPFAEISPADLESELDRLLEFMFLNGVAVDFLDEVTAAEAYRFIVDELFDEKCDDMRGTGMTTHFSYDEFHPNAEYNAKMWAEDFVLSLLHHHQEGAALILSEEELYDRKGAPTTRTALLHRIATFQKRHPTILDIHVKPLHCQLHGDYADVELATTWTSVQTNPSDQIKIVGRSHLRMKRAGDYWETIQAKVAGWD